MIWKRPLFWLLIFSFAQSLHAGFVLWLDSPRRDNPYDPSNSNHVPFATATPTIYVTPGPSDTPSNTPTPTPNLDLLASYEPPYEVTNTLWVTGTASVETGVDALGSSIALTLGAGSTLTGGSPGQSACISGQIVSTGNPYCVLYNDCLAGGINSLGMDILPKAPNQSLAFSYKASAVSVNQSFLVQLASHNVTDGGYYRYEFSPTDTAWHKLVIYFPGSAGTPLFAQPSWAAVQPWATTADEIQSVLFEPLPGAGSQNYSICFDDVDFSGEPVPSPTPTPIVTIGPSMIANYEPPENISNTLWVPNTPSIETGVDISSTVALSVVAGSPLPGGSSGQALNMAGTIYIANSSYAATYNDLTTGGTASNGMNVTSFAPNSGLEVSYQASTFTVAAGVSFLIVLASKNVTDYGFYRYEITPADSNWHQVTIYFPGGAGPNYFAQPSWGAPQAWTATVSCLQSVLYEVIPAASPAPYSISFDDLSFY